MSGDGVIAFRVVITLHSGKPGGVVTVVVILMDGGNERSCVEDACAWSGPSFPHDPGIPIPSANHERREVMVEAARISEVVRKPNSHGPTCGSREIYNSFLPIGLLKVYRLGDICIPALADHEEWFSERGGFFYGLPKTSGKNDVAVDVTEDVVGSDSFGVAKKTWQGLDAGRSAMGVRHVANPEFATGLFSALLISKQNHLDIRIHERPASDSISLDDSDVTDERLRRAKDCKH